MEKLASNKVAEVLNQVAPTLRAQAATIEAQDSEISELRTKVAHYEKKERAEKIASVMESKKLDPDTNFSEKVAGLMERDNLDVVEEAVGMAAPQMKVAALSDNPGAGGTNAEERFVAELMGS